jgi:hypothetical protein
MRIDALAKPAGQSCPAMLTGGGCATYATRPAECAGFECLWLHGEFRREDRPDRTGITFVGVPNRLGTVMMAHVRPAGLRAAGKVLLEELQRTKPVFVVRGGAVEMKGPPAMVEALFYQMQAHPPKGISELTLSPGRIFWRLAEEQR